jgi:hypothetical protein
VQPEVIAAAILNAGMTPRREYWIGWSTILVILGNMLLPRFLDRYLATTAYRAQETRVPMSPAAGTICSRRSTNCIAPAAVLAARLRTAPWWLLAKWRGSHRLQPAPPCFWQLDS